MGATPCRQPQSLPPAIQVEVGRAAGRIRRLHGINLAAPMARGERVVRDLEDLHIPLTRLHDAPLENPGMGLVDVSMVFPRFDADPQDPANYRFAQTDDYLLNCLACAERVSYRLGESIEHTPRKYAVIPPRNPDHWADICINIIRHYNEGWADGFHHNLDYWHIWEEPDNIPSLWAGTWDAFIDLYVTASRKIKQRFPQLKIGGCAMRDATGWEDPAAPARLAQFLEACRVQQAPLDFFTWTCYPETLERILREPVTLRAVLDLHGFAKSELHLAEWHYIPDALWGELFGEPERRQRVWETINSLDSAAFVVAALTGLQDTPLDMANYYTGSTLRWGFYDPYGVRNPCYYAMKAFSLLAAYEQRIAVSVSGDATSIRALAARRDDGRVALLVSCLTSAAGPICIQFRGLARGVGAVQVLALDGAHNLEPLAGVRVTEGGVTFNKTAGAAVYLVEAGT